MSETKVNDPLTHREKIALRVLMVMFVVVKPFGWTHEITEQIKELKAVLAEEKK